MIVLPVVNVPGSDHALSTSIHWTARTSTAASPAIRTARHPSSSPIWVFQNVIKQGDYYVDLHGGDLVEALVPFSIWHASDNAEVDRGVAGDGEGLRHPLHRALRIAELGVFLRGLLGILAMLSESGGQGIWLPEHVADHTNGLARLMLHLGLVAGPAPQPVACTLFERFVWLRSDYDGFWYPRCRWATWCRKARTWAR